LLSKRTNSSLGSFIATSYSFGIYFMSYLRHLNCYRLFQLLVIKTSWTKVHWTKVQLVPQHFF
jgi:hypothetical protein